MSKAMNIQKNILPEQEGMRHFINLSRMLYLPWGWACHY